MTTPNITGLNAWGTNLPGGVSNPAESETERAESFMSVMTKTANGAQISTSEAKEAYQTIRGTDELPETGKNQIRQDEKPKNTSKNVDTAKQNGRDSKDAKEIVRDDKNRTQSTDKTKETGEVSDGTKEVVEGKASEIKAQIAKELDITVEELEQVMETLGITQIDLLNPQTVPQLVAEVSENDISAVITDESLYNEVNDILSIQRNAVSDIMQELDITKDEFTQLVNTISKEPIAAPEDSTKPEMPAPANEDISAGQIEETKDFEKIMVSVEDEVRDEVRTPAEANPERIKEDGPTERKPVSEKLPTEGQSEVAESDVTVRDKRSHYEGDHQNPDHSDQNKNSSFIQNLTQTVAQNVAENAAANTENFTDVYAQTRNILDQIDSQIKVGIKQDTTSMEMQLNPATLGRINVRLEAVNGEITARFEAQNAQVRAALEGHVAELKQSLENQGVKIESVEVTVASHEFEQNLMQGQEGNAQNAGQGSKSSMRRINLNEEDEAGIEGIGLTPEAEAERIARSMMSANGGTVDFQA